MSEVLAIAHGPDGSEITRVPPKTDLLVAGRVVAHRQNASAYLFATESANTWRVEEVVSAGGSAQLTGGQLGRHDTALFLSARTPTLVELVVAHSVSGLRVQSRTSALWSVSVQARSQALYGQAGTSNTTWSTRRPFILTTVPTRIDVSSVLQVSTRDAARDEVRSKITVHIAARPTCNAAQSVAACSGQLTLRPELDGTTTAHAFSWLAPNAPSLLLVGTQALRVRIPGSQCFLANDPQLVLPFLTDANGAAQLALVPRGWLGSFRAQAVFLPASGARFASEGLSVQCR